MSWLSNGQVYVSRIAKYSPSPPSSRQASGFAGRLTPLRPLVG